VDLVERKKKHKKISFRGSPKITHFRKKPQLKDGAGRKEKNPKKKTNFCTKKKEWADTRREWKKERPCGTGTVWEKEIR